MAVRVSSKPASARHSSPALIYAHLATDDLPGAISRMPTMAGGSKRHLRRGLPSTKLAQGQGGLSGCARKPLSGMERVIGIETCDIQLGKPVWRNWGL